MSKLLSVIKGSGELAKVARRDIYILLIFLVVSALVLILFEPVNTAIFNFFNNNYSNVGIEKMLIFLVIFSLALCFYSIRRWKEIYEEASQSKELEAKLRQVQTDLENQVRERTEDISKANTELDEKNNALEILNTITRSVHTSLDIEKICETAIEMTAKLEYVDTACIYLVDETGNNAELKYHSSNLSKSFIRKASVIKYPEGITWKVINSGEVEIIENIDDNTEIGPAGHELNLALCLAFRLRLKIKM